MRRFISIAFALCAAAGVVWAQNDVDQAFLALRAYDFGGDSKLLEWINERVIASAANSDERKDLEARLIEVLTARDAGFAAKQFASKQLYRICSEESVPKIAPLLLQRDTSDLARYVLERVPGPAATRVLVNALGRVGPESRIGIINSLGERGDPFAVPAIRRYSGNGDPRVMRAAILAMGAIGGPEAADAIQWCSRNVRLDLRPVATEAYLRCANRFLDQGDTATAISMYEQLYIEIEPLPIRMGALAGLIAAEGESAAPTVISALEGNEPKLRETALSAAYGVPGVAATIAFAEALPRLGPEAQAGLLRVLAGRGDPAALGAVYPAVRHSDPRVRMAALDALGTLGDADAADALLRAAALGVDETEREVARAALHRLNAANVDMAIQSAASDARNAVRTEAVRAMAARRYTGGLRTIFYIAENDVDAVRAEAWKALGVLAGPADLPRMIDSFLSGSSEAVRREGEGAITAAATRSDAGGARVKPVLDGWRRARDPETRAAFLRVMGRLGDDAALPTVRSAAKRGRRETRVEAVRALAQWPTPAPLDDLASLARNEKDAELRDMAVQGFLRVLRETKDLTAEQKLGYYAQAVTFNLSSAQKKQLLAGLSDIAHSRALELLAPFLADPEVQAEAGLARDKVQAALAEPS